MPARVLGEPRHRAQPAAAHPAPLHRVGQRRLQRGRHEPLEVVHGGRDGAVLVGDHLALLGELEPPPHRAARLGQDRAVGGAAAARDRAAAAVEELHRHAVGVGLRGQRELRDVERPGRREVAAVLGRVRVADHDLLAHAARAQLLAVGGRAVEALHRIARAAQRRHALEQRHEVDAAREAAVGLAPHEPRAPRQHQQLEHVGVRLGVADHELAHRLGAPARLRLAHGGQRVEHLGGLLGQLLARDGGRLLLGEEQLLQEALLLVELERVERALDGTQQRAHRLAVAGLVLAHVEAHEVEADRRHLLAPARQLALGEPAAAVRAQARVDEREVAGELVRARIAAARPGRVERLVLGQRQLEAPRDRVELLAIDLAGLAAFHALGEARHHGEVALDAVRQLLRHRHQLGRGGEPVHEARHLPPVRAQRGGAVQAQRLARHPGGHGRVAVAVAADPGAEPHRPRGHGRRAPEGLGEGLRDARVHGRHRLQQHRLEGVDRLQHLVDRGRAPPAQRPRLPQRGDLARQQLVRARSVAVQQLERVAHPVQDLVHGPARRLGGMRGEHDRGAQGRQRRLDGGRLVALRAQPTQERVDPVGRVAPLAARHVALLAHVHELEEDREGARHPLEVAQREIGEQQPQPALVALAVLAAQGAREPAHLLHQREHALALLLAQHLPQHLAREADLGAQPRVQGAG